MTKEDVLKEIKVIHNEYDKPNGKCIKPSFKYIVVMNDSDDFIVTTSLHSADEKAIEYGDKLQDWASVYEVIYSESDKTYKAKGLHTYVFYKKDFEDYLVLCDREMHVAWRTRGDLLEICY